MNIQSWSPKGAGIAGENLALWNAALSHAGEAITFPDQPTGFRFMPIEDRPQLERLFVVSHGDSRSFLMKIDGFPFKALLDVDLSLEEIGDLDPLLQTALNEGMIETIRSSLPPEIGAGLRIENGHQTKGLDEIAEDPGLQWFSVAIDGVCAEPIFLTVGAQRDDVCDYMRTQTLGARALWTTLSAQIPVFVDRLIGTCDAHWRDVKALQRADILLLKGTGYQQSLLYQNTLYGFAPAEEGWQLQVIQDISGMAQAARRSTEAPATMMQEEDGAEMPAPEADQPEAADESAAAPIPDVQVALTFDLGQVEVPIATLESWQPGTIVDLGETPNAADAVVTIRANGTAIAEGDIVQLDDRIGVRVTRLLFNG